VAEEELTGPSANKRAKLENKTDIADRVSLLILLSYIVVTRCGIVLLTFVLATCLLLLFFLQPPTDFFGRLINVEKPISAGPSEPAKVPAAATEDGNCRISYKFNEGNSAAVRKPVKVSSFI
jgi:hypothetical protein